MLYQAAQAREYKTAEEMRASYRTTRAKFSDDQQLVASLRATISCERQRHADEIRELENRLSGVMVELAEFKRKQRLELDDAAVIASRAKYSFPIVLQAVCKVHGVTVSEIKNPRRHRRYVNARDHLAWILRTQRQDLSEAHIGRLMWGRDHTTIMAARHRWPEVRRRVAWALPLVEAEISSLANSQPVDSAHNPHLSQQDTPSTGKVKTVE